MGTDIHGKFFVKRIGYNNQPYWQDLEPAYHYRWNDGVYVHLWDEMFGTTINDRLKETMKNFPGYRDWVDTLDTDPIAKAAVDASGDAWTVHSMLSQNYKNTVLALDTEFHRVNGVLNAVLDRNYVFFSAIADVRNGVGFAGTDTGDAIPIISEPRGFEELPFEVDNDDWDFGDHSYSWVTLGELTAYNWERTYKVRGTVPVFKPAPGSPDTIFGSDSLELMLAEGRTKPNGWSGAVSGRTTVTVGPEEAKRLVAGDSPRDSSLSYYTRLEWEMSIRSRCEGQVEAIEWLAERLPLDTTYFVFGFDS